MSISHVILFQIGGKSGLPIRACVLGLAFCFAVSSPAAYTIVSLGMLGWLMPLCVSLHADAAAAERERHRSQKQTANAEVQCLDAIERIRLLEADLVEARQQAKGEESSKHALYKQVGLHPNCPEFVVAAVRRAYRIALHPDRQPPRLRAQAHARFVAAEQIFDDITSK